MTQSMRGRALRTKIKADPIECCACHLQVLGRGGDLEGWVAVQKDPDVAELSWFCMKPACQHAYFGLLADAQQIWLDRMPQDSVEEPELPQSPLVPSESEAQQEAVEELELDQSKHDQSGDQAPADQARIGPPSELVAYETSDQEEMGFKDEVIADDKIPFSFEEKPENPSDPPPAQERYVPRPSVTKSEEKFVRHDGTGPKGKSE